ncbi:hypothetical protein Gohar_018950 [Gossypium harknessii]|uniref:Myb/SANT-like domain-containing protein n=1 Tax=Gossypium harknessii TaxID=34285 RepID=A0A7J9GAY6_9ROSI|nr:hypothetical protein [Gossypium harknessii]
MVGNNDQLRKEQLKKEWKAWKKFKGKDIGLGWNPIKRTVDTSNDWWESRLNVVPEAQKFRTLGIDPEFEGKLDQMFMGIVATVIKHGHLLQVQSVVNILRMLTTTCLKRKKKKMR